MGWPFTPAKTTIDTYVCIGVYICTSVFLNSHSTKLEHTARGCRAIKCSVNWSAWLGDLRAIRQRFPTPAIRDGGALQNIQNGWQGRWFGRGFSDGSVIHKHRGVVLEKWFTRANHKLCPFQVARYAGESMTNADDAQAPMTMVIAMQSNGWYDGDCDCGFDWDFHWYWDAASADNCFEDDAF